MIIRSCDTWTIDPYNKASSYDSTIRITRQGIDGEWAGQRYNDDYNILHSLFPNRVSTGVTRGRLMLFVEITKVEAEKLLDTYYRISRTSRCIRISEPITNLDSDELPDDDKFGLINWNWFIVED